MVVIEMREAAYDKVFELLEEVKDLGKEKKMTICKLEDAIWDCYEASKDKDDEYDTHDSESEKTVSEMDYRRRRGMRHGSYEDYEDDDRMYGYRRRGGMRMRGSRYGRYSY